MHSPVIGRATGAMLGQGLEPQSHHALGQMIGPERLNASLASLAANFREHAARMPTHQAFLDQFSPQSAMA